MQADLVLCFTVLGVPGTVFSSTSGKALHQQKEHHSLEAHVTIGMF